MPPERNPLGFYEVASFCLLECNRVFPIVFPNHVFSLVSLISGDVECATVGIISSLFDEGFSVKVELVTPDCGGF